MSNKIKFYNNVSFLKKSSDLYIYISKIFNSFPIDLLDIGLNEKFLKFQNPYIEYIQFNSCKYYYNNINDLLFKRVHELSGENVYICWSGGIDSSAIIASFFEYHDRNNININILYNTHSINENSELFYYFIKNRFKMMYLNNALLDELLSKNEIVICGTMGDLILSPTCESNIKDNLWYKIVPKAFHETIRDIHKFCPYDIKTYYDSLHWIGLSQCWNGLKYMWDVFKYDNKIINFFDTDYFIEYGIKEHFNIWPDNIPHNQKSSLQKIINKAFGLNLIFKKIKSGNMMNEYEDKLLLVDTNNNKLLQNINCYADKYLYSNLTYLNSMMSIKGMNKNEQHTIKVTRGTYI